MRYRLLGISLLVGVVAVLVLGAGGHVTPESDAGSRPPVFLITIETTRADHIGPCYGYNRSTAPNICSVAEDGVRFTQAYSQGSLTPVALPALLTSQHPRRVKLSSVWDDRLPDNVTTILDIARQQGYEVRAVSPERHLFSANLLSNDSLTQVPATNITRGLGTRTPFWWAMPMYPHEPFTPEEKYRLWDNVSVPSSELPTAQDEYWHRFKANHSVAQMKALYDATILQADAEIGAMISQLKAENRYDDALIIITADHGEHLGEHTQVAEHSGNPYQAVIHVPLIIKFPGSRYAGTTVTQPVRHLDVVPTILDVIDVPRTSRMMGRSLLPAITGNDLNLTPFSLGYGGSWAVKQGAYKYLVGIPPNNTCSSTSDPVAPSSVVGRLYNIEQDPDEQRDVSGSHPEKASALHDTMCTLYQQGTPLRKEPANLTDSLRNRLEQLGYSEEG